MGNYDRELAETLSAIELAGVKVMRFYAQLDPIVDAPADITTEADRTSQDIILGRLSTAFPNDQFCGEESTAELSRLQARSQSGSQRVWVVDPIDGTRGFARKSGEFSILIGLVEAGRVVLGAVLEPAVDRLTYAVVGQGCFVRTGSKASETTEVQAVVRDVHAIQQATVAMSRSRKAESEHRLLEIFQAKHALKSYSAGVKMAQIARGEADLYLGDYPAMHDWDICAGVILIEEAGGVVTNLSGEPLSFGIEPYLQAGGVLASNGRLHPAALAAVADRPTGMY